MEGKLPSIRTLRHPPAIGNLGRQHRLDPGAEQLWDLFGRERPLFRPTLPRRLAPEENEERQDERRPTQAHTSSSTRSTFPPSTFPISTSEYPARTSHRRMFVEPSVGFSIPATYSTGS